MSRAIRLVLTCLTIAAVSAACGPASSSSSEEDLEGRFVIEYKSAESDETAAEEDFLRDREILEDFAADMNDFVAIPEDVNVVAEDCDESNAYYDPEAHSITICYELAADERTNFSEAGDSGEELDAEVYQSMVATLYHEAGHALIGELELAVTGREEDVADQMAAYILTIDEESKEYLLTTADSYALSSENKTLDESAFADVHSLDEQRSANFLCYVYGSDEDNFAYLVDDEILDADRAETCGYEFEQLVDAWDTLLAPYVRA